MEGIFELIAQLFFEVTVGGFISTPGAFVLRILGGLKKKTKEIKVERGFLSYFVGILFWITVALVIISIADSM